MPEIGPKSFGAFEKRTPGEGGEGSGSNYSKWSPPAILLWYVNIQKRVLKGVGGGVVQIPFPRPNFAQISLPSPSFTTNAIPSATNPNASYSRFS